LSSLKKSAAWQQGTQAMKKVKESKQWQQTVETVQEVKGFARDIEDELTKEKFIEAINTKEPKETSLREWAVTDTAVDVVQAVQKILPKTSVTTPPNSRNNTSQHIELRPLPYKTYVSSRQKAAAAAKGGEERIAAEEELERMDAPARREAKGKYKV
jgi:hypothetical protein